MNQNVLFSFKRWTFGGLALLLAIGTLRAADQAQPSSGGSSVSPAKTEAALPTPLDQDAAGKPLFDGKTLQGWKITDFAGHGEVMVDPSFRPDPKIPASSAIILEMGAVLTGITWTNPPPEGEFEIALEAMKLEGSDFFCALTFPAAGGHCSLIIGGWGGGVVGISSLDGMDASENETTKFLSFERNRWYAVRVRVTKPKIEAWIDKDKVVDVETSDRRVSVRAGEIELAQPLGLSAFQTKTAYRNIRLRSL